MLKTITPFIINTLTGQQLRRFDQWRHETARKLQNKPHTVHVFLRINDPISLILVQLIEQQLQRFDIE